MKYIPVAGTWSRKRYDHAHSWYRTRSPFDRTVSALGYERVDQDGDPERPDKGFWSGDINGLMLQWVMWWRDPHPDWKTGGEALRKFMLGRTGPSEDVTLFLHSHGGQVGAYALAGLSGVMAANLSNIHVVTCDMPVRADMADVYAQASLSASTWTHLYSERGWKSMMRWLGDGTLFSNPRKLTVATTNIEVRGGHSGYLSNPQLLEQWKDILGETEAEDAR